MDEKTEQLDELPEPLEIYEPEPLLKPKNLKRGDRKIGRPLKTDEEKEESYIAGRAKFNQQRRDARKAKNDAIEQAKKEAILKAAADEAVAQEVREEEIFQRKLKQREDKARAKAEAEAKAREDELDKAEKQELIKRVKELESMQVKKQEEVPPPIPTLMKTPARPARPRVTRLYL
jgi:hypothetical protein